MIDHLKTAALAAAIVVGSLVHTVAQEQLTPERIEAEIIGRDIQAQRGVLRVAMIYQPDGTVEVRSLVGRGSGTWAFSEDGMCIRLTSGPRTGEECFTISANDDGTYAMSNGMQLVRE